MSACVCVWREEVIDILTDRQIDKQAEGDRERKRDR